MNIEEMDIKSLVSALTTTSKASSLEMPALLIGVMALIPGFLDESIFGIGAIALLGGLIFFRRYLKKNRENIIQRLTSEQDIKTITNQEYSEAIKALNILTIPGGQNGS